MDGRRALRGWGRTSPSVATVHLAGDDTELVRLVTDAGRRGVLARGLGRSYGDAAQNGGGVVVDMTSRHRVLSVDTEPWWAAMLLRGSDLPISSSRHRHVRLPPGQRGPGVGRARPGASQVGLVDGRLQRLQVSVAGHGGSRNRVDGC